MRHKSESSFLVLEIILENSIEVVPDSSTGKESACNAGDLGSIPGLGRSLKRRTWQPTPVFSGFPGGSDSKESAYSAGTLGFIPGLRRSPEGGRGNPLQYSCLENPMDRGVWRALSHRVAQSDTTEVTKQQQVHN